MSDVQLREGSPDDFLALARIDGSIPKDWVLYVDRRGGPGELGFDLRWRQTKESGSVRDPLFDEDTLQSEWKYCDRLVVAEEDGQAVGYAMLGEKWNRTAEITIISVHRPSRGRGIGGRLVAEAEEYGRERGLRAVQWEAQNDNRVAIEFALARGFRIAGFHDALYRDDDLERQEASDYLGLAVFLTKPLA